MGREKQAIADNGWHQVDANAWDHRLARLSGHPLQSAAWGEARQHVDRLESIYLISEQNGMPHGMARVETRRLPLLGKVAWIPRGPVVAGDASEAMQQSLCRELKQRGFAVAIFDHYRPAESESSVHTIWIDLTLGTDGLKRRIDKQWMYGVRRAGREGVEVVRATTPEEVTEFFRMCAQISQDKDFELPGSEVLMQQLLLSPQTDGCEMQLFLAKHEGKIGAGAFVARSGEHLHYFWGASDRELSRQRVGEAVQWAVIEWGIGMGCSRYDLEGIDPINNPGVYAFKKKMGGEEVSLAGKEYIPLNRVGGCALKIGKVLGKI
ncbi:GNAT family N-acetyltransferase [Mariprofundus sp. KV]|uniref:lipid II:glycine glycyltransferase FemX n=1 Tax=Mariprofundus sp. KV TaxID=2608715 RepID=UPI0015A4CB9E|nr:GNAT family N-acetyltransferase [Mariprofundus sp. KV]NWF35549.1 GNAT family N-acetyltransferase [Mariprofundus sp. KV]